MPPKSDATVCGFSQRGTTVRVVLVNMALQYVVLVNVALAGKKN